MRAIKTATISILALGLLAGSAVGVAAQDEAAVAEAPAYFTVEWGEPSDFIEGDGTFTLVDIGFEATDPRASGLFTITDATRTVDHGGQTFDVVAQSVALRNDDGAWSGTAEGIGTSELSGGTTLWKLDGLDGYDGLSLFLVSNLADETWGIIVPANAVPTAPEMPPVE